MKVNAGRLTHVPRWNRVAYINVRHSERETAMAVNKPTGDNARKGAVKKRTQLKNPLTKTSAKRNKKGGEFMAVKKSAKKFKGAQEVR
jgi:hypothetical protein